jgi:D-alanyl-D-alanine carboxypeptidase
MKDESGTIQAVGSFLVGVAFLIAACSRPGSTADSSALKPIDQAALQNMMDTTAKELLVPGAVLLLRTPQGEFKVTYGTTQLGTTSPPRADTHFRIASNTKSMTAAVIVQLAQEGKLSLDDPVSKYVPGVPNGDNITIDELLKMRSGLYNYTDAPELAATVDRDPTKVWTTEELLALAFARPPNFPSGTAYEYNNTNYTLLGLIAEKVDGKPMARAMQDRLFGPLGMHDTLLPPRTSHTIPDPYSHGYLYGSSLFVLTDTPYPPDIQAAARAGTLLPTDYTYLNPSFAYFPGGVFDAAYQRRWLDSLQAKDPSMPNGQQYGYGIERLRWGPNAVYFHGGETPGYNSHMGYDPNSRVTFVTWTNLPISVEGKWTSMALVLKIWDQIYVESPLTAFPSPTATP